MIICLSLIYYNFGLNIIFVNRVIIYVNRVIIF